MSNDGWARARREDGTPIDMYARESPAEVRTGSDAASPTYALTIDPKSIAIRGPRLMRTTVRVEKEGGTWQIDPGARGTMPGGLVEVWLEVAQRERWDVVRDLEP